MKNPFSKLKEWKAQLVDFLFSRQKKHPESAPVQKKVSDDAEEKWEIQPYIVQDEFYVTQSGQLIRQPVTRRKYYKARRRSRKRTK